MINRELVNATVVTYGGIDSYGQMLAEPVESKTIEMTFGVFNHTPTTDVRYQNVEYYGLTKDKDINDTMGIIIDGKEYKVIYVNPCGRLTQVFLK
jgi:hypothetical protein